MHKERPLILWVLHENYENEESEKINKKMLAKTRNISYNVIRCELIAKKREVATQHYRVGFPWSKCQVINLATSHCTEQNILPWAEKRVIQLSGG